MHSRIFEVSKDPLYKGNYITEDKLTDKHEWFLHEIADYVTETSKRQADLKWLGSASGITVTEIEVGTGDMLPVMIIDSKKESFKDNYEAFKSAQEELAKITEEDFAGLTPKSPLEEAVYRLTSSVEDKFGFWIYNHDNEWLTTLDSFIRRANDGDTYFIGEVLDYHS